MPQVACMQNRYSIHIFVGKTEGKTRQGVDVRIIKRILKSTVRASALDLMDGLLSLRH